jgi:hypothetical protein
MALVLAPWTPAPAQQCSETLVNRLLDAGASPHDIAQICGNAAANRPRPTPPSPAPQADGFSGVWRVFKQSTRPDQKAAELGYPLPPLDTRKTVILRLQASPDHFKVYDETGGEAYEYTVVTYTSRGKTLDFTIQDVGNQYGMRYTLQVHFTLTLLTPDSAEGTWKETYYSPNAWGKPWEDQDYGTVTLQKVATP